ncbi:MAG: glycoside hydrolase family 16 protein [Lunatimonas sp.]|uniref:glycoside hydrolase family 16 protein n=1 Tax=Lunatimonas sp. TaxID=2060141 RepID=UPI00263B3C08|nr:glycoside hydrolase family 16 protein [Lunatimonas sp.]MCC5936917.1 glycoside hydrolase family 16 protein [Lunatimonas sp.]
MINLNQIIAIGLQSCSLCFAVTNLAAQQAFHSTSTPEKEGYELRWSDEFEVNGKPNSDHWSYEIGFVRNREHQWYQEDNAEIKDGKLIITGRREWLKNPGYIPSHSDWRLNREFAEYTSSSLHTRSKVEFQYGWVEVRAKIDTAVGLWPAIWTLGKDQGWPANGEIDIMEYYLVEGEPTILANAAWAHVDKRAAWDEVKIPFSEISAGDPDWVNRFHTWEMDWTAEYIRIYLDGKLLNEVNLDETVNPDGFNPFRQPHYLLLNLAIGENGGDPSGTEFPRHYEIDYVRIYQKKP